MPLLKETLDMLMTVKKQYKKNSIIQYDFKVYIKQYLHFGLHFGRNRRAQLSTGTA